MSKFSMMTIGLAALAWVGLGALAAFADEVTTTTVTHTEQPDVVISAPPVIVEHQPDCVKKKTTTSDDTTGETVSKTVTKCD